MQAYLSGNLEVLKDWCHEAVRLALCIVLCWHSLYFNFLQAFNVLSAIIKQRTEPGIQVECKVLEVRDVDVSLYRDEVFTAL